MDSTDADAASKPELLAPAGNVEAGLAAFDAGADAIYVGLPRFNARERGENCTLEQLAGLIGYAERYRRRVYVTLNTLVTDAEIPDVAALVGELAPLRPDAVIVQDLGVVRLIRDHFPTLSLHASTQMGIHNSTGVEMAAALGIERVILERQVTEQELAAIRRSTDVELEVFIHGALCCGRSGRCLLSSWLGGWSGNRGQCKQPCRRRYFSDDGNGFFLSPGDLYSLPDIPRLQELGISSLKIEGRLRYADYVWQAVKAYRMMLDAAPSERSQVLKQAKQVLSGALGRKWVRPFRDEEDFERALQHRSLATAGQPCGKVLETGDGGFRLAAKQPLRVGDTVRIQPLSGEEGPALTLTRLSRGRALLQRVGRGQTCWVHCDKPVLSGSVVYKVKAADVRTPTVQTGALPEVRRAVDLRIELTPDAIRVVLPVPGVCWDREADPSPARNRPLSDEALAAAFRRGGGDRYRAGQVAARVAPGLFVPASALNQWRRDFWEWLDDALPYSRLENAWRERAEAAAELPGPVAGARLPPESVVCLPRSKPNPLPEAVVARPLSDWQEMDEELVLPDFCPESELPALRQAVDEAVARGAQRFRVASLFGIGLIRKARVPGWTASLPLPVSNSYAVAELQTVGAVKVMLSSELPQAQLAAMAERWGTAVEVCRWDRPVLLSTRFPVAVTGRVTDGRGTAFLIRRQLGLSEVLPESVLALPVPDGVSDFVDLRRADLTDEPSDDFNYRRDWV